ncbi:hypothetical protein BUALT_Bualt04G0122000 [Buddleja alternifolia]|uniref:Salicylic acid binding protein 2 n=1 Tax=Buddleja alternifolia TaxID=168488 RepID=A0AAV6XNC6_9LAMI|nr:hypothetical protein BUALT_Bualt04G0122000 [Buddleja alternifolia]
MVHGACHGAWCLYKVLTLLRSEGYHVTALDMAAAGANPKRVEEVSSIFDYSQPLMDFMAALPPEERVVLYQRQLDSYMDGQFIFGNGEDKPPPSLLFGPKFLPSQLYQLSPPEDLTLATLLVRPVGISGEAESSEAALSKENHGLVRRAYVVCERDNTLKKGFQEWMIEKNPTDDVKMISGADHMVMFSKSQQDFAEKYC